MTGTGPDGASVVVGLDRRPGSDPVLRWAVAEAARLGRPLRIVRAVRPDPCRSPDFPEMLARTDAARLVAAAVAEARRSAPGVRVTGDAVVGSPAAALVAATGPHDLLVVGDRTRAGSTCRLVVRHARSSVVVVRGGSAAETGPVAVGYDGSAAADAALATAFAAADARRCAVTVVRVDPFPRPGAPDGPAAVTARAALTADTRRALAPLTDRHPRVTVDVLVVGGDPVEHLVAASREARLVVVGARAPGRAADGTPGPVGPHLLTGSLSPVLIVRPGRDLGPYAGRGWPAEDRTSQEPREASCSRSPVARPPHPQ
jgi:nucleotide-binding universal stress UspA family protein